MQMILSQGQISDLFFNYDHPEYSKLYAPKGKADDGPTYDEVLEAITKDADEFATCYPADWHKEDMVAWLVKDFMRRR